MEQNYSARQLSLLDKLRSWATLQDIITELTEEEAKWLMECEVQGANRLRLLNRLYSRFCVVRKVRELAELSQGKLP